ncbi:11425_t:CDS:10 [Ambispora gerdemannii]|uniref:11425_t:CDS:1 n=1 Tax=Ambispora gerdemannii TaxID=144530 RepID=A0A9N9AQ13_9GLOM|nr:11425_t:CDS:10 [Ambispora gerdemannii]
MIATRTFLRKPYHHHVSKLFVRALQTTAAKAQKECFVEELDGEDAGIAMINFNRPQTRNAISRDFLNEFQEAIEGLRHHTKTRVVLIRSLVDKVFCSGADLKERATMSSEEISKFLNNLRHAYRGLETLPMPTIAVIDGAALGGGLELALCCDMRVAGEHAKIGLPETKLAIIPGAGGTQRLMRVVGLGKAKELIFTGRSLNEQQALDLGIVNYAVKKGSSFPKSLELAREILPSGPIAIRLAKLAIDRGSQVDLETGLDFEKTCYDQTITTGDRIEALKAFSEKRLPVFKGR